MPRTDQKAKKQIAKSSASKSIYLGKADLCLGPKKSAFQRSYAGRVVLCEQAEAESTRVGLGRISQVQDVWFPVKAYKARTRPL